MVEFSSAAVRLAYAREDTTQPLGTRAAAFGGTGGSVTPRFLGISDQSIDFPDKRLENKKYRSAGFGRTGYFLVKPGKRTRPGSIPFIPTTAEFLFYGFGLDTFTAGVPNVHVLSPANLPLLPTFSLGAAFEGSPNFQRIFAGCMVDSLSLSLGEGNELRCTMDVQARKVFDEELASPSLFAQPAGSGQVPYMFYDRAANVTMMGTFGTNTADPPVTGGRTWARVVGFDATIRNSLSVRHFSQSTDAQDPNYYSSYPDLDLRIEIVPAGKLSGDVDAVYDLLENETKGDILIPFQRTSTDKLYLLFTGGITAEAPHPFNEQGNEVSVSCRVDLEQYRIISRDSVAQYSTL